jgi:diguanylate cyclase
VKARTNALRAILLITDNLPTSELITKLLNIPNSNWDELYVVENLEGALRQIRTHPPLCCLLDTRVKTSNDQNLVKSLRREYASDNLPLLLINPNDCDEDAGQTLAQGAQDYLTLSAMTTAQLNNAIHNAVHTSQLQKQLNNLAHYDSLTGLLNRNLLYNRLSHAVGRCNRYGHSCAVLIIDLNNFKPINEIYGYDIGDQVLQYAAECIRDNCRSTDSPARMGGAEFVVLLEHVDDATGQLITEKIVQAIQNPFTINDISIQLSACAGIATYPVAASVEELLKHADEALNLAKNAQDQNWVSFSSEHKERWSRQQILERELAKAIDQGDLALVYQPIVCAKTHQLRRLEALSRWPRNDFAIGAPELINMIDRLQLIEPFHEWLFHTAFKQMQQWKKESIEADICLNIPANYCYRHSILHTIELALSQYHIDPSRVELEITESTLMLYPERSVDLLQRLHDKGIRIAVDDFGTGYSSMAYLTLLPLDTLKIDKQFFIENSKNDRNRKVIEAVTALGHSLGLDIIAEGVETGAELQLAKQVGCDLLQGYYFGRPQFAQGSWSEYTQHFNHIMASPKTD